VKKIIVCGSRDFADESVVNDVLTIETCRIDDDVEIVSGGAKGADTFAANFAKENGYPLKEFLPEWNNYGRGAGPYRNKQMIDYCSDGDMVIAFWDGKSKGTKSTIDFAKEKGLVTKVYTTNERMVSEGVKEGDTPGIFVFDFKNNSEDDIISFTDNDIKETKQLGQHLFFGYHMRKETSNEFKERFKKFVHYVKSNCDNDADVKEFLHWFVVKFCDEFENTDACKRLSSIIIPKSSSPACKTIAEMLSKYLDVKSVIELQKKPNNEIGIDWNKFEKAHFRTPEIKEKVRQTLIKKETDARMKADKTGTSVSLSKSIPGRYRKFIGNMFVGDESLLSNIDMENGSILLLDDVYTTGKSMSDMIDVLTVAGFHGTITELVLFRLKR